MLRVNAALILCALVLSGCATAPPKQTTVDWASVLRERQSLSSWQMTGRAAVTAANEGWNASLEWKQTDAQSQMRLYGPFGAGALRVTTDGETLNIETSKGETFTDADARTMLEQTLGTSLPLKPLRYWLLGVPQPGMPALSQLNAAGHLGELDQDGWHVTYERYGDFNGQSLPSRLLLEREGIKVRVVADRWQL